MNIAIVIFVVIIFAELTLRLFWPQHIRKIYVNGMKLGKRDPEYGYLCTPLAHLIVKGPEFSVEYKINENGLRDESPLAKVKSDGTSRILIIGDSFTFGAGVSYDCMWLVIAERRMADNGYKVEIIKAGSPFRDTYQNLSYLKKMCSEYNPDIAVLSFIPNNLFRNQSEIGMNNKSSRFHAFTFLKRLLISNDLLYALIYSMTNRVQFFTFPFNDFVSGKISAVKKLLNQMRQFCQERDIIFLALSVPQQFQLFAKNRAIKLKNIDPDCIDRDIAGYAEETGFAWIPILPAMSKKYQGDKLDMYFRLDGHLNNEGNRFLGEMCSRVLSEELNRKGPRRA